MESHNSNVLVDDNDTLSPLNASYVNDKTMADFLPARHTSSRKGQNGKVLVVGGSNIYHGAPILSSLAALRFCADLVYTAVPKMNAVATRAISSDLIVLPMVDAKLTRGSVAKLLGMVSKHTSTTIHHNPTSSNHTSNDMQVQTNSNHSTLNNAQTKSTPHGSLDSAAIGMGLAIQDRTALIRLVDSLVKSDVRLVLDASALVPEIKNTIKNTRTIVTPHAGEFLHLFGHTVPPISSNIQERIDIVRDHALDMGITIILKGSIDIISDGKITYLCDAGTPGMTTGGTGDVLTGIAAGALAICDDSLKAATVAAYVNGKAGEIVSKSYSYHMIASDLIDAIPVALSGFDRVTTKK